MFFLFINYKIIINDVNEKIIPNKYLFYLILFVPFFYIYLFSGYENINIALFVFQIFLTFFVSFFLYNLGIWAAGDAKYLLILGLFIPNIGIIPFIGNLSLITIIYLFIYFLWFYLIKVPLDKGYRKSLFTNIKHELLEKWNNYKKNKGGKSTNIILKGLLIFLTIFVSIRLTRIYIFDGIIKNKNLNLDVVKNFIENYNYYIAFFSIIIFILFILFIKKLYYYISYLIHHRLNKNINTINNIFLYILLASLISFILYQFTINPIEISRSLYKIFTLYIILHIFIKMLLYSYKVTFGIAENQYINIKNLKIGDIVDKFYLLKLFGEQDCLKEKNDDLYLGNPNDYFMNLKNPVDNDNVEILKKTYNKVNKFHKKNLNHQEIDQIKILKTFAFGPYIFAGFFLTFVYGNKIFVFIVNNLIEIIKKIVS